MLQKNRTDAHHIVEIREIIQECRDVKTYFFDYPVDANPGQFVMVWIPGVDEIPLSVSYTDEMMGITVKFIGEATRAMAKLKVGDRMGVRGPYGTYFERNKIQKLMVVAGGIGIAPLAPAVEKLSGMGTEVTVALGAVTDSELLFEKRLRDSCELHIATDDGSRGYHGFVSDVADDLLDRGDFDGIFSCGPEIMLKKVLDSALKRDMHAWICLERYMKCGVGICDSCAVNGYLVCRDGPVFSGEVLKEMGDFGTCRRDASGKKIPL